MKKNHAARSLVIVMANMKIKSNATAQNSLHQPYGCMGERLWRPYGMDRRQWQYYQPGVERTKICFFIAHLSCRFSKE